MGDTFILIIVMGMGGRGGGCLVDLQGLSL